MKNVFVRFAESIVVSFDDDAVKKRGVGSAIEDRFINSRVSGR